MAKKTPAPPIVVIYGDEEHRKETVLTETLDRLLPPEVDRALALSAFDASQKADQGGPTISVVLEDLCTLPFLTDRRVVVIREADSFVTAHRERLERYAAEPAPTGVLVLVCRSFPKTTRLSKATVAAGGQLHECKRLVGRAVVDFVVAQVTERGKRLSPGTAARLVDLVGTDTGALESEVEKLCLYVGDRPTLTDEDVSELVGLSREEKVFAVVQAAAEGRLPQALELWNHVLETDSGAVYKCLGGIAFKIRQWLSAQVQLAAGASVAEIAPKVMMWKRERELQDLLRLQSAGRLRQALAAVAQLDSQAKSGARSIENGVEMLLVRLAAPAR